LPSQEEQNGRFLHRPQQDYPAATVAEFCTAVLTLGTVVQQIDIGLAKRRTAPYGKNTAGLQEPVRQDRRYCLPGMIHPRAAKCPSTGGRVDQLALCSLAREPIFLRGWTLSPKRHPSRTRSPDLDQTFLSLQVTLGLRPNLSLARQSGTPADPVISPLKA
jgi:hypothetical protein